MALDMELALTAAKPIDTEPELFRGMFAYTTGSTGRPKGSRRDLSDVSDDSDVSDVSDDKYAV